MSDIKYMDVRFVNPFVVSAVSLLKEMADINLEKGNLEKGLGRILISGYGVVIGVTGDVAGQILYEFPEKFAYDITEILNNKKRGEFGSEEEFIDMSESTINELGNMISGKAITMLSREGINCVITPPTLFHGVGIEVISKNLETILVPFNTPQGALLINVAMQKPK